VNARSLLAELSAARVDVRADGGDLVVRAPRGALTPVLRARLLAAKPELLAELHAAETDASASYEARELACYRAYVAALARAHGYDEPTIARACEWLALRRGAFRVTRERIEIVLAGEVKAIFRRTS
jgi:hypothetical protein